VRHPGSTLLRARLPRVSCACLEGWVFVVFVGYIDEYGEEREASYACRRCAVRPR
jgi:hypothetical protein